MNQDVFTPGWRDHVAGLRTQQITFSIRSASTQDALGARTGEYQSDIVDPPLNVLPCKVANVSGRQAQGREELKGVEFDRLQRMRRCVIFGYYPTITEAMRATVDGQDYDVVSVQSDSHAQLTRVLLEQRDTA